MKQSHERIQKIGYQITGQRTCTRRLDHIKPIRFSFYIKGQVEVVNRLYIVAAPEFVNLTSFEARAGVRYIFPISNLIGIGVEPGYSFVQKQVSLNTNIHFAL